MLVTLLLILILIVITLFCWLSLVNPVDIDFHFFGKTFPADLSTLMISSFVLGVLLVFLGTLARDAKRAFREFQKSRQEKKEQVLKEELEKGMEAFLRGDLAKGEDTLWGDPEARPHPDRSLSQAFGDQPARRQR